VVTGKTRTHLEVPMNSTLAVAALTSALVLIGAPLAHAKGGDATIRTGSCNGSADWKLKAKHDDGRLEVEYEVDSNRAGQTWQVRVRDNRALVVRTRATTGGRSGSFSVERRIADRAGTDHLVARARDLSTGQLCVGRVSL
jgi:hypothetical protein